MLGSDVGWTSSCIRRGGPRRAEATGGSGGAFAADDGGSSSASDAERPSERSTVPTLGSTGLAAADSSASMIERSVSELESVHEVSVLTDEALAAPLVPRREPGDGKVARAISEWPRALPSIDAPAVVSRARTARRAVVGLLASHGVVAVAVVTLDPGSNSGRGPPRARALPAGLERSPAACELGSRSGSRCAPRAQASKALASAS